MVHDESTPRIADLVQFLETHTGVMLSNLLSYFSFSNTHYDSYMLLFRSLMLYCIHIVPEDPDVVEIVGAFTGRANPSLPRTIRSIQSCESLGEIEFGITEEDGVWPGIRRVRDLVAKAYKASSTSTGDDDKAMEVGADEMRLRQCEHALREGFHAFIEERRGKKVTAAPPKVVSAALPRKFSVELRRISRSRPGPVWDESMLTSFPH